MRAKTLNIVLMILLVLVSIGWYLDHKNLKGFSAPQSSSKSEEEVASPFADMDLEVTIIPSEEGKWGFEITTDGQSIIRQPNVPGLSGNLGFNEKDNALRAGELVISKIQNKEFPPTISVQELKENKLFD